MELTYIDKARLRICMLVTGLIFIVIVTGITAGYTSVFFVACDSPPQNNSEHGELDIIPHVYDVANEPFVASSRVENENRLMLINLILKASSEFKDRQEKHIVNRVNDIQRQKDKTTSLKKENDSLLKEYMATQMEIVPSHNNLEFTSNYEHDEHDEVNIFTRFWNRTTPTYRTTPYPKIKDPVCDMTFILVMVWSAFIVLIPLFIFCGYAWYAQGCPTCYYSLNQCNRLCCEGVSSCFKSICCECCCDCCKCITEINYAIVYNRCYPHKSSKDDCGYVNCGFYCCLCFCCGIPLKCEHVIEDIVVPTDEWERKLNADAISSNFKDASAVKKACIEDLVNHTWIYKNQTGRDGVNLRHERIVVEHIWENRNRKSKKAYMKRRDEMREIELPPGVEPIKTTTMDNAWLQSALDIEPNKEVILFHGTQINTMKSVMKKGFLMKYANERSLFGKGLYFAESGQKSDQYADGMYDRRHDKLTMVIARVALGKMKVVDEMNPVSESDVTYDSAIGGVPGRGRKPYRFREIIITKENQCYPAYVIIYRRE